MPSSVALVFPHQLFKDHPAILKDRRVYLIEEDLFFNQYHFNKKKIILHRASMKGYQAYLEEKGLKVFYIEARSELSKIEKLLNNLAGKGVTEIYYADVTDNWLEKHISKGIKKNHLKVIKYKSPYFITDLKEAENFFLKRKTYFQTDFYKYQRKRLGILLDGEKPSGGKWSYDEDNRLKFPKGEVVPEIRLPKTMHL